LQDEYISKVVEEYAKPLVEDPRKKSNDHSSIEDDLPASFTICESRMINILARNKLQKEDNEEDNDNDNDQQQLLKSLIENLRESQDEEFDLEDADHGYLSDEEEDFPEIEFDPLQYASVRTQNLCIPDTNQFEDRVYWNIGYVACDIDELLKNL